MVILAQGFLVFSGAGSGTGVAASDARAMSNGEEGAPLGCTGLPQGWTAYWSTRHPSRVFYHNAETGVSRWKLLVSKQKDRYFPVDVLQSVKDERLGLLFERGTDESARQWLKIVEVVDNSVMQDWNARCAATFPPDQLRPGDKIVEVNNETDIGAMEKALELEKQRIIMVVMRSELEWSES